MHWIIYVFLFLIFPRLWVKISDHFSNNAEKSASCLHRNPLKCKTPAAQNIANHPLKNSILAENSHRKIPCRQLSLEDSIYFHLKFLLSIYDYFPCSSENPHPHLNGKFSTQRIFIVEKFDHTIQTIQKISPEQFPQTSLHVKLSCLREHKTIKLNSVYEFWKISPR